jgi:hypothetical protein
MHTASLYNNVRMSRMWMIPPSLARLPTCHQSQSPPQFHTSAVGGTLSLPRSPRQQSVGPHTRAHASIG